MARERYSSYVQRAQSDSEAEEHIFVGGKDAANGGVRKRVGDIRFWLEDRERRRQRPGVNAPTPKSENNKRRIQNSPSSNQNRSEGTRQPLDAFSRISRVS